MGDSRAVRWVSTRGPLNVESLGFRPIEGGHESSGNSLYIAQGYFGEKEIVPGKVRPNSEAVFAVGGREARLEVGCNSNALWKDLFMLTT